MPRTPRRAVLFALVAVVLGLLCALAAVADSGRSLTPWWTLVTALCLLVPFGSWSARSVRSRLVALAAVTLSSAVLVCGLAASSPVPLLVLVLSLFTLAPAMLLTPHLRGHRVVGLAVFAVPLLLLGAAGPSVLGGDLGLGGLARTGPAAILSAVRPVAGPAILLGGTATLVGCLLDLAVRLRTSISAEAARGVAFTVGGLALTLVAAAGAVAAGSLPGTPARVGSVGVLLVLAGVLALARGLRELGRTRELSGTGGILTVLAVLAVLGGALLAPADALLTAISLAALLSLAGVLGAVTGLCGAAALVRLPRRERIPSRVLPGLRARLTQAPRS